MHGSIDIADEQAIAHFSLREEAQNTERRHFWNPDLKLRHARVAFVSGGHSTLDESIDPVQGTQGVTSEEQERSLKADALLRGEPMAHLSIQDSPTRKIPNFALNVEAGSDLLLADEPKNDLIDDAVKLDSKLFFIDTEGTKESFSTKLSSPLARRSQSPELSDSSNEIVVFSGRCRAGVNSGTKDLSSPTTENIQKKSKGSSRRTVKIIENPVIPSAPSTSTNYKYPHSPRLFPKGPPDTSLIRLSNARQDSRMRRLHNERVAEDEILADYIANINDSDDQKHMTQNDQNFAPDLGGTDDQTDDIPDETAIGTISQSDNNWDLSDMTGLEDLSTSSEVISSVGKVLSKRERALGVQYLIIEGGHTVDDARWIPQSSLAVPGAEQHIKIYESSLSKLDEYLTDSNGSDDNISSHRKAEDLPNHKGNRLEVHDLSNRRMEKLQNEKTARLLSKQEELGLGSNGLLLYDGDEDGKDDEFLPSRKAAYTGALRKRGKNICFANTLPTTSAFAGVFNSDTLDGVDVKIRDHPKLRKKSKGHGIPDLELTDTEYENSIQLAWANDRAKKKIRKQEREELRAQGLLGKKSRADAQSKYSRGISLAEIKDEIEKFLLSSVASLNLPPIGPRERKMVHDIANVLGLKSKSNGSGRSRFPVLYRTTRTVIYDEDTIRSLEAQRSWKHFLPRRDRGLPKGSAATRNTRGGGFNNAAVSYRDGEIVGATAPELGQENKGRAMLEKMGWSTGTALGALNNKGIMQPLAQVVKTTKAGLG
ncbi:hypothetical protein MMC07_007900 [Pseudocyphellaria aurata]|nr:hypothetical protein [Pseudocyphellaria aurata]